MDLTAILALLNGLGPWGIAIGIGLMLLVQKLNIKLPTLPANPNTPSTPSTPSTPTLPNLPLPSLSDRPLLNLLLSFLTAKGANFVSAADLPVLELLHKEVGELKEQAKSVNANTK